MKNLTILALMCLATVAIAEEGMWTLDNFPSQIVLDNYGVEIDDTWLVSSADNDIEADGFYAPELGDEARCEAEQLSVLVKVKEITEAITQATKDLDEAAANEARKQKLTELEQGCGEASDGELTCEAVSLYHGGQYYLYGYKRYDDVRLVFAPETDIANFGGDPDNFNFPRWNLDMALLRAYENARPAQTPDFLPIRSEGPDQGEPVFVPGHPGGTSRLLTVAELEYNRNVLLPLWLVRYLEYRGRLIQFGKMGEENHRISQAPLQRIENGIKVQKNRQQALLDNSLMQRKRAEELELIDAIAADPKLQEAYGSAWDEIAEAIATYLSFRDEYIFIESGSGFFSELFGYARTLVRAAEEREKPNEKRFREYTEAALPQQEQRLLAAHPIYPDLEELKLSFSLDKMREFLGPDSSIVHQVLGKESPEALAHRLVSETKLADPDVRRKLWEGGAEAIATSEDPMIRLAVSIDAQARALRQRYEDEVEAPWDDGSEKIAKARFATQGTEHHPDATFTLRVSFGRVEGWEEKGSEVFPFTTIARIFERATGALPFRLPQSWLDAQGNLDPDTRFNFVASTDVIGGNSGSPMVDAQGRLIGLVFDGNIHSIGGEYWFDSEKNRTVAVHPAVMIEALTEIYDAERLLDELMTD
jgi:hypothetical protein